MENSFGIEAGKKIKLHLILKCGEVLLAHYAPLPCIIWCFFVLYGSTKDTAIERAYCRNSARQVIVVRLYLKYLGVFRYFLVRPDYWTVSLNLLHIYSWNSRENEKLWSYAYIRNSVKMGHSITTWTRRGGCGPQSVTWQRADSM